VKSLASELFELCGQFWIERFHRHDLNLPEWTGKSQEPAFGETNMSARINCSGRINSSVASSLADSFDKVPDKDALGSRDKSARELLAARLNAFERLGLFADAEDGDRVQFVPFLNLVYHFLTGDDVAEDGVLAIKPRSRH